MDGLRAVSIVAVLIGHLAGDRGAFIRRDTAFTSNVAHLGVTVFFVISGFLITTLLMDENARNGSISLGDFYARRILRIVPAFLLFVVIMICARLFHLIALGRLDTITALTWTVNYNPHPSWAIGHLWSLSVEEQFYFLWPAALASLGARRGQLLAAVMFIGAPLTRAAMHVLWPHSTLRDLPIFPAVDDAIAIGCIVAISRNTLVGNRLWNRLTRPIFIPILTSLILIVASFDDYTVVDVLGMPLALMAIAIIVEGCTRWTSGIAFATLNSRLLIWIGTLSYSIYLWQQPFLDRYSTSIWARFPLNLCAAVLLAICSFFFVEKPFLALRRRFSARNVPPAPSNVLFPQPALNFTALADPEQSPLGE